MIALTEQQRQSIRNGNSVRLPAPEIGADCIIVRADIYERLRSLLQEEDGPDMHTLARLIDHNMREEDANDPLLESYQDAGIPP
jgi:hypothetical protein